MPDVPERVRFAYPRRSYLLALAGALGLILATGLLGAPGAGERVGFVLFSAVLAIEGLVVLLYVLPVLLTAHELRRSALKLRFGLFEGAVPYEQIAEARLLPSAGLPRLLGWGVHSATRLDRLFLLSSHSGLVELRLRGRLGLGRWWSRYQTSGIVLSLRAPEKFLRQLEARLKPSPGGLRDASAPPSDR